MAEISPVPGSDPTLKSLIAQSKAQQVADEKQLDESNARIAAAQAAQGAAMKPKQEELRAKLGTAPVAPEPKPIPQAPAQAPFDQKEMGQTLALITTLAALGGALTRAPLTAGLDAFSAGVNGWLKGDKAAYDQNLKEFHAKVTQAQQENEQVWRKYLAAKDKYKTDIAGLQNELKLIAAETQSPIDMELAKKGDVVSLMKIHEKQNAHYESIAQSSAKMQAAAARDRETRRAHGLAHEDRVATEKRHADEDRQRAEKDARDAKLRREQFDFKQANTRAALIEKRGKDYKTVDQLADAVEKGDIGEELATAIAVQKFGKKVKGGA